MHKQPTHTEAAVLDYLEFTSTLSTVSVCCVAMTKALGKARDFYATMDWTQADQKSSDIAMRAAIDAAWHNERKACIMWMTTYNNIRALEALENDIWC